MASPSFHNPSNSNYESLFVSPSPDPQLPPLDSFRSPQHHQQQQQWERPSMLPRNPSFTLPRPVPSLQRQNSQNHPQPDPTLYQNRYFQQRSSGGQAGSSRQQGGRAQVHPTNYPQQNQQAYQSYQPQHSYYDLNQQIEPRLPSPSAAGATNGNLTPSRFELENGENYLTSTPEGGWNFDAFLDPEYSDGLGLVPRGPQNSNSNNHNNNNSQNNNLIQEPDLFHPTWNNGADPFAPPDTPPILHINRRREPREQPREQSRQPRYGVVDEDRERQRRLLMHREEEVLVFTHTSPTMSPRGTKRSAPGAGASGTRRNMNASPPLEGSVAGGNDISPPPAKRAKTSTSTSKPSASDDTIRDLFGSPGKEDEVDLVGVNDDTSYEEAAKKRKEEEVAKARKAEQEKPVKLVQQQCVICLDQPDGLTVTHCGHMFCAECLHGALNTNMMGKKVCPVCRSTINTNKNKKGEMARSGIFHMEMKLQTRKKGKQPQRS